MQYFKVILKNGRVLDFDKKCSNINYKDDRYLVLSRNINKTDTILIAMIRHDEISIVLVEEEEECMEVS